MKKVLLLFTLAISVFWVGAQAAGVVTQPDTAEIKWDSLVINYGTITQDSEQERELKFTNVGRVPLLITSCRSSCGCLVPSCPVTPIAPGSQGSIRARYDTHRIGPFQKTITIVSNTKAQVDVIIVRGLVLDPDYPVEK